ncbi:hypothetical protein ANO11243_093610 [Dothideomycetidae sp. 11243]|nr:hypothetical protein ANO11243_093610 [fungal sp. No.11243]
MAGAALVVTSRFFVTAGIMKGFLAAVCTALAFFGPTYARTVPNLLPRQNADYLIGVGKADITGPVVELNLMGYADPSQIGTGLRQRLYTRAFIMGNPSDSSQRVVYLVLDTAFGDTAIRNAILKGVAALGSDYSVYTKNNIAVTGTHAHSGPGGWANYLLPQVTNFGFNQQSFNAVVQGSILAIQRAHESLTAGSISVGTTDLVDGNINRSPYAYDQNPAAEKAQYQYNTDKTMTMIKLTRSSDGKDIGVLNWYAVHGTSLYENNTLSTGDNKGVAAYLFEQFASSASSAAPGFVAGFSQANVGDTTPNVLGAFCDDTGLPCKYEDSTCGGKTQGCHGRGPFYQVPDEGASSCFEMGTRQYNAALSIYQGSMTPVTGSVVTGFHTFQDFSSFTFTSPLTGQQVSTCSAALGYGFAGGTTDGPGFADFTQGANTSDPSPAQYNPLWAVASAALHLPSAQQVACQSPKPILFDAGATLVPYQWAANIIDSQLLRVGSLIMIVPPGEATTMSGRRWRNAVAAAATNQLGISNPTVVIAGPSNTYGHYIATAEEYSVQRYEGASTLHGPHSLEGHIYLSVSNINFLSSPAAAAAISAGPTPPDNSANSLSFIPGVVFDTPPWGKSFGQVVTNPSGTYSSASWPTTVFVGADPRNNLRLEGSYAVVQQLQADGSWSTYRTDADWGLVFRWERTSVPLGNSQVSITWEIEPTAASGTYRMLYFGDAKLPIIGSIDSFTGTGGQFTVQGV